MEILHRLSFLSLSVQLLLHAMVKKGNLGIGGITWEEMVGFLPLM
jgi:hypothetical protein